jgi:uncharacterized protein (TIGR03067 family)
MTLRLPPCVILGVLAVCCVGGGPVGPDLHLTNDHANLQGEWAVTSVEISGQRLTKDDVAFGSFIFADDKSFRIGADGKPLAHAIDVRFALMPRQSPAILTTKWYLHGNLVGQQFCIYAIHGDSLRLCISSRVQPPLTFTTRVGDGQTLYTLARVRR